MRGLKNFENEYEVKMLNFHKIIIYKFIIIKSDLRYFH